MIALDTFIDTGNSHRICEDYIVSGDTPIPYIILADGCSTSDDTEMGARILCHLAKQYLRYQNGASIDLDYHKTGAWVIHNAEMTARQLGLKRDCLNATLIIAWKLDDKMKVFMYGDGVIVHKRGDDIITTVVDYTKNAPYYLSYLINEQRSLDYHNLKTDKIIRSYLNGVEADSYVCAYDCPVIETIADFDTNSDVLLICSDGVTSFIVEDPSERKIIDPHSVIPDLISFKNFKGEYLKRRVGKALKNLNRNGIVHFDDLSIGSFISR